MAAAVQVASPRDCEHRGLASERLAANKNLRHRGINVLQDQQTQCEWNLGIF